MSLDLRLRDGLVESARVVDPDVEAQLFRTRATFRRRRVTRQVAGVMSVAVLAVLAVVVGPSLVDGSRLGSDPAPATSPSPSLSPSDTSIDMLDGTWATQTVTEEQVRAVLGAFDLGASAPTVLADLSLPARWTWTLLGGSYTVASESGRRYDLGRYTVSADPAPDAGPDDLLLTLSPFCACTIVYGVHLYGDTMTLTLISDTSPDQMGVADEAFQHAIYTVVPFVRATT